MLNIKIVLKTLILSLVLCLINSSNVLAHVTVSPSQIESGKYINFSVNVPNERDINVTSIKLEIPDGVSSITPNVKASWQINLQKDNDMTKSITWSGGTIPTGLKDEFLFTAKVEASDDLVWKAYQTYEDGVTISWDKSETEIQHQDNSSENESKSGPYSISQIIKDNEQTKPETTNKNIDRAMYLSVAAVIVALIALIIASKPKN